MQGRVMQSVRLGCEPRRRLQVKRWNWEANYETRGSRNIKVGCVPEVACRRAAEGYLGRSGVAPIVGGALLASFEELEV